MGLLDKLLRDAGKQIGEKIADSAGKAIKDALGDVVPDNRASSGSVSNVTSSGASKFQMLRQMMRNQDFHGDRRCPMRRISITITAHSQNILQISLKRIFLNTELNRKASETAR